MMWTLYYDFMTIIFRLLHKDLLIQVLYEMCNRVYDRVLKTDGSENIWGS